MKYEVVLGLGSNRSFVSEGTEIEPPQILEKACRRLSSLISDIRLSSVYQTEPMYVEDQPRFYNMAVSGFFDGEPLELLDGIQLIEADYGRCREHERRFGERSLDIDIELFSDMCIKSARLEIPHPRLCERAFILVPLLEILPFCADIKNGAFYERCLRKTGQSGVKYFCGPFTF
ncbi:2-amino-4-hydroxy-6-hydroxymethyldihydropteridine diphosphokinase [Treponema sp. HNW]|uniref:2-amino-4-hydroxy-6- hydroxymethyldihydropteridine diphosphokinase n=1 Tax=Treponema sp. HNW TaxID=3116654 RepID=UPI003D0BE8D7